MIRILFIWLVSGVFILCSLPIYGQSKPFAYHIETASDWTQRFASDSNWIGGDGLFSFALNGVDTVGAFSNDTCLLVFSDSFWGQRVQGELTRGGNMVNNTGAFVSQKSTGVTQLTFFNGGPANHPRSLFVPLLPDAPKESYYWLGDGFVNQEQENKLYLFAYLMKNTGAAVFGFKEVGNALIIFDPKEKPPFQHSRQLRTPLFVDSTQNNPASYSFGAGVLVNTAWAQVPHPDGYVYVYGVKGKDKALLVARVKPKEIENFECWQYWNGAQWGHDIQQAQAITRHVSNELSVTPLPDGRYLLIFQKNGIEPIIGMRIGASPVGPFGPIIPLYHCPEPAQNKNLFAYNAKAHPVLSKKGELLISYHVNSFRFLEDFKASPSTFSPKFIRLVFKNDVQ